MKTTKNTIKEKIASEKIVKGWDLTSGMKLIKQKTDGCYLYITTPDNKTIKEIMLYSSGNIRIRYKNSKKEILYE